MTALSDNRDKKMETYGVLNYLDISTGHIPENVLKNTKSIYHVATYPEGAFFWVPSAPHIKVYEEYVPDELNKIFKFARERNCTLIRFDCDGFEYPELPKYDW